MAKKKKNRLKKFLKGAALAGAAALGASALGKRNQMKTYLSEEGGDRSDMRDYGPYSKRNMNAARNSKFNPAMMLSGVGDDPVYPGIQAGAKKGGRAGKDFGKRGVGKAKRGFGRALKGGKK
jgi:hypothetical protein